MYAKNLLLCVLYVSAAGIFGCAADLESTEFQGSAPESTLRTGLEPNPAQDSEQKIVPSKIDYTHPISGLLIDGKIPFQEVKNTPDGHRIAMGSTRGTNEDATPHLKEGIFELKRSQISDEDRQQVAAMKLRETAEQDLSQSGKKISAQVLQWFEGGEDDAITLYMRVPRPSTYTPITLKLEREIARGNIKSLADRRAYRKTALAEQQVVVRSATQPAVDLLMHVGASVDHVCKNMFCLRATVTRNQFDKIRSSALISRIDVVNKFESNVITGTDAGIGMQWDPLFIDYDGDSFGSPMHFGVLEHVPLAHHVAYRDYASSSSSRIALMRNCNNTSCSTVSSFTNPQQHASWVVGSALADLTQGQDSSVTIANDRKARSGWAHEAEIYFWSASSDFWIDTALDDIVGTDIQILNMSIDDDSDTTCLGENAISQDLNDVYDSGILTFIAAANNGHSSTTNCLIDGPASAIGAFVVGAHGLNVSAGVTEVRSGAIAGGSQGSSRGGTSTEGKGRTIVDMTGPSCRQFLTNNSGGYRSTHVCGTSIASPTVAAMATAFIEWYEEEVSHLIEHPGHLHNNMLLFGDRENATTAGFDNLFGAGRIKLRRPDTEGMDSPWQWGSMVTCIDHNEVVVHDLNNGNKISSDVEPIKVVGFFYDRQHEQGSSYDDIDLRLQRSTDGVAWTTVSSDTSSKEEKMRVFEDDVTSSSYYWRIHLSGFKVTSDDTGCGTNSIRVFYSWFYEDSDRDDTNGPSLTDVEVEQ